MTEYDIGSAGYLDRAAARLREGMPESLFYAALELRCYVEARQDEYLATQTDYVKSVPPAWKIGKQWKALEGVMKGPQIQHLHFTYDDGFQFDAHYVPVTSKLRNAAERLSNLIHAQQSYRSPDDQWWQVTRSDVVATFREAWVCAQGRLLSPALISEHRPIGSISFAFRKDSPDDMAIYEAMAANGVVTVQVNYLEAPPSSWISPI